MGVCCKRHTPATLPPGNTRYPLFSEAEWAPRPVWTGAENLASTRIRSTYHPARNVSLHRLSYPSTQIHYFICFTYFPHIHSHTCLVDRNNVISCNIIVWLQWEVSQLDLTGNTDRYTSINYTNCHIQSTDTATCFGILQIIFRETYIKHIFTVLDELANTITILMYWYIC
jgi:hypothetical protein